MNELREFRNKMFLSFLLIQIIFVGLAQKYTYFILMGPIFTILAIEVIGMMAYRVMTWEHIVSLTSIRHFFEEKYSYDTNKVIESCGVDIIKDIIQNIQVKHLYNFKVKCPHF